MWAIENLANTWEKAMLKNSLHKHLLAVILAGTALSVVTPAFADDDVRPRQAQKATITSEQAKKIATATEKTKGGRVMDIEYDAHDDDYGVATYDVEVVSHHTQYDVKINAKTGKIIHVKRDNDDWCDDHKKPPNWQGGFLFG